MKTINATLLALLFSTACGTVVDPEDSVDDAEDDIGDVDIPDYDAQQDSADADAPGPELPVTVAAARPADSSSALFHYTFDEGEIDQVILSSAPVFEVLEQSLVTRTTEAFSLRIDLASPTGRFSRGIVTDAIRSWYPQTDDVDCSSPDPRCSVTVPSHQSAAMSGPITQAHWRLSLVDAAGLPVPTCVRTGTSRIDCSLPSRPAGTAYFIRVAAGGFSELWNWGNGAPRAVSNWPSEGGYTGLVSLDTEYQCTGWEFSNLKWFCTQRDVFTRIHAVDTASLEFDPMHLTISSGETSATFVSAALTWNAGNEELPGDNY